MIPSSGLVSDYFLYSYNKIFFKVLNLFQDAIKYENGREIRGQSIVVEWARGPSYRSGVSSYFCCLRCFVCMNVCPVFRKIMYNSFLNF